MNLQGIEKFNLINDYNKVKPNYDLGNKEVDIELFISKDKELCIMGRVDNNYICWCSVTNIGDKEHNEKIFDYIANSKFTVFSQEYKVLGTDRYTEVRKWYRCAIVRAAVEGEAWRTPFGAYYGLDNKEDHGRFFAIDMIQYFDELLSLCEFRSVDYTYNYTLEHYLKILRRDKDYRYYYKVKPLISILEKESYLRVCSDSVIRDLYLECMEECSAIYGRCMSVER